jgi:hypothetical protein
VRGDNTSGDGPRRAIEDCHRQPEHDSVVAIRLDCPGGLPRNPSASVQWVKALSVDADRVGMVLLSLRLER